jgi:hypothetical protein
VDSTTGVARDDWVRYDNDATGTNWRLGRVRKIISGTQLEFYSLMPGLTNSGVLRTISRGKTYPTHIEPFGDEWLLHGTGFNVMYQHATFQANYEGGARWRGSRLLQKPTLDRLGTPGAYLTLESNTTGSVENLAMIRQPVISSTPARRASATRRDHALFRR